MRLEMVPFGNFMTRFALHGGRSVGRTLGALTLIALCFVAVPAQAALDGFNINSSAFTNTYDGNEIWDGTSFINEWSATADPNEAIPSLSGTTLTVSTPGANGWIQQDSGISDWENIGDGSWTFETQLTLTEGDGVTLWLDPSASATGRIIYVGSNGLGDGGDGSESNQSFSSESNIGTNIFRVAFDSSEGRIHLWKNSFIVSDAIVPTNPGGGPRLIIGDCCSGGGGVTVDDFDLAYVRYDTSQALSPTDDTGAVTLSIDRGTGAITIANTSGDGIESIIGYSLLSPAGALDQSQWTQQANGTQLANDDDDWTVLTAAGETTDLSEGVLNTDGSGDGGDLVGGGGSWTFGNIWAKSPFEDVAAEVLLKDGTILSSAALDFGIEYTGDALKLGDIAGATVSDGPNGTLDLVDWLAFRTGVGTDISNLSLVQAYQAGDLNADLKIDSGDYTTFVAAYNAANGTGAFQAMAASVPEPSSLALIVLGLAWGTAARRRRWASSHPEAAVVREYVRGTMKHGLKMMAFVATSCLIFSSTALAVSDFVLGSYNADAGNPGNAAAIQSPELQGWTEWASGAQGQDPTVATQVGVIGDGNTNAWLNDDTGNTNPGYYVEVPPAVQQAMFDFGWKYEAVLTMIASGHFTALGVDDSNPWGLPANARVGFAPSTDGDTITFDPQDSGDAVNVVTPAGTVGDFYRVVMSGDVQSTGGTFEVFDFSDGTQVGSTQNFTSWAAGNALNANRLGLQSGSSGGSGRTAQIHALDLVVPAPETLSLEVNTTTGQMKLINHSGAAVSFNGYFINSEAGALAPSDWNSLEDKDIDGNGTDDDGIGWEEFDAATVQFLGEGFLTGATTLANGESLSLGAGFDNSVFGPDLDGDLTFTLTDAQGRSVASSLFQTVDYTTGGSVSVPGDYNDTGLVEQGDLDLVLLNWGDSWPPEISGWVNDQPTDGTIDQNDLDGVLLNWGNSSAAATAAVPEPSSGLVLLVGTLLAGAVVRRRRATFDCRVPRFVCLLPLIALITLASSSLTQAAVENERDYRFGDPGTTDPVIGGVTVTEGGAMGFSSGSVTVTGDESGPSGAYIDLIVSGPTYTSASTRPGAGAGDFAAAFDGDNDNLYVAIHLNSPSAYWDDEAFFPAPNVYPLNYEGIFAHGIQLWAKPDPAGLGQGNSQGLALDTLEQGITITENDTWGLWFDAQAGPAVDSGVPVDSSNWTHVMQIAGFQSPVLGNSAANGALLVNGIAVAAQTGAYDNLNESQLITNGGLAVGAMQDSANEGDFVNHYNGAIDDLRVFLWGDNSNQDSGDGRLGKNWGTLNLGEDNDWIAAKLAELGVTDDADVNLDGAITAADGDDFLQYWRNVNLVDGLQIGDWNSRQNGDLNWDGVVNLSDVHVLNNALVSATGTGFDFAALGIVPEPASGVLLLGALSLVAGAARRRRRPR